MARNLIVHYRASGHTLPEETQGDINARWLEEILALDQARHSEPLTVERSPTSRVQGCCRDHTLFCVGVLRSHQIPARSRVGYAGYIVDGWHHDHVIVEAWIDGGWRRFDPELEGPVTGFADPMDMDFDDLAGAGFVTAAQVWRGHRRGEVDADTYGVDPDLPILRGEQFVFDEVIYEIAHRFGDELLLWDGWGRMAGLGTPVSEDDARWLDPIADLLLAADAGDPAAEALLSERYHSDDGLRPGATVIQASPFGHPPIEMRLSR